MVRSAGIMLAALAAWLVASPAAAERVGIVAFEVGEAPATGGEVEAALAAAGGAAAVRDPFAAAERARARGAVPRARLEAFREAEALARTGWRAFLGVEPERALATLSEAKQTAAAVLALPGGAQLVADVALRSGAVKLALGRDGEARAELALARRLDPARAVTTAAFSPEVVEAYEQAAGGEDGGRARVAIAAEPEGAAVEVDAEARGAAPVSLELAPGLHAVVARAPGRAAAAKIVDVPADGADELKIELALPGDVRLEALEVGRRAVQAGTDESAAAAAVEALHTYADLDGTLIAVAVWHRGAPALLGQRCTGSPARCGRPVEIGYRGADDLDAAARELWSAAAAEAGIRPPTLQVDPRVLGAESAPAPRDDPAPVAAGSRQPWWGSPWLWGGVGAAALGAAAAILATGDGERIPEVRIPACEFGGC